MQALFRHRVRLHLLVLAVTGTHFLRPAHHPHRLLFLLLAVQRFLLFLSLYRLQIPSRINFRALPRPTMSTHDHILLLQSCHQSWPRLDIHRALRAAMTAESSANMTLVTWINLFRARPPVSHLALDLEG
jgi:hypothetical protein